MFKVRVAWALLNRICDFSCPSLSAISAEQKQSVILIYHHKHTEFTALLGSVYFVVNSCDVHGIVFSLRRSSSLIWRLHHLLSVHPSVCTHGSRRGAASVPRPAVAGVHLESGRSGSAVLGHHHRHRLHGGGAQQPGGVRGADGEGGR